MDLTIESSAVIDEIPKVKRGSLINIGKHRSITTETN